MILLSVVSASLISISSFYCLGISLHPFIWFELTTSLFRGSFFCHGHTKRAFILIVIQKRAITMIIQKGPSQWAYKKSHHNDHTKRAITIEKGPHKMTLIIIQKWWTMITPKGPSQWTYKKDHHNDHKKDHHNNHTKRTITMNIQKRTIIIILQKELSQWSYKKSYHNDPTKGAITMIL